MSAIYEPTSAIEYGIEKRIYPKRLNCKVVVIREYKHKVYEGKYWDMVEFAPVNKNDLPILSKKYDLLKSHFENLYRKFE